MVLDMFSGISQKLFDPILSPLLNIPLVWSILIICLIISVITTLIYKYTTDQNLMKQLKSEMKELQAEIKRLKDNPKEAMKVQQKAMQTNMKYTMQSFKSMFFTIIPVLLIFGWFTANLAYEPIHAGEEFTVTALMKSGSEGNVDLIVPEGITVLSNSTKPVIDNKAEWTLSAEKNGDYLLEFRYNKDVVYKDLKIDDKRYAKPVETYKNAFKMIQINNKKTYPFGDFRIFGWQPGWFGTYIIFSIIFSIILRKLFKVY